MLLYPDMRTKGSPRVYELFIDEQELRLAFSLRADALIQAHARLDTPFGRIIGERRLGWVNGDDRFGYNGVFERRRGELTIDYVLPLHHLRRNGASTAVLLTIEQMFKVIQTFCDDPTTIGEGEPQLVWVEGWQFEMRRCAVCVVATPMLSRFIAQSSDDVFAQITFAIRSMGRVLHPDEVPISAHSPIRRATKLSDRLHLNVGGDCACVGVDGMTLGDDPKTVGWVASGHNIDYAGHMMMILAALAKVEMLAREHLRAN